MCGIAGILNRTDTPAREETLRVMNRLLAHRGPDGEGVCVDGPVGFGHRRLAVLDLSSAGAQPMKSADGQLWITYNGEIFNFQELRTLLESHGHRFRSRTDTEVILAAYQEWGHNCLSRFNGMFAFALWDARKRMVWLVRDRLGVKPLFYAVQPTGLVFASEIKSILPALAEPPRLNEEALHHFLSLNYVPAPETLFAGIRQLLPGQHLSCRPGEAPKVVQYWDGAASGDQHGNAGDAEARLESLLSDAVRLRLVSDVEVGAFLSGGMDSSALVVWMQRHVTRRVKTFAASFREASYNEAAHARKVASVLGTQHGEQLVASDDLRSLPKIVWHSEELTADSSMLALYRLAQRARQDVTVVLTGDGGDELFGGYPTYLATSMARMYRRIPRSLRERVIRPMVGLLPVSEKKASFESRLRRFVGGDVTTSATAHASWRTIFTEAEQQALMMRPSSWQPTASLYEPLLERTRNQDFVNRLLYADLSFYLPNDMLVKVDRMTMAWGLEARTPYLDYRVVELAAGLPSHVKCGTGLRGKRLLRRITRGVLPSSIRFRTKAGFNIPQAQWLRHDQRSFVEQHLLDVRPGLLAILRREEIERLVREHMEHRADHAYKLWSLLCLSLWWQQFMDGHPVR